MQLILTNNYPLVTPLTALVVLLAAVFTCLVTFPRIPPPDAFGAAGAAGAAACTERAKKAIAKKAKMKKNRMFVVVERKDLRK